MKKSFLIIFILFTISASAFGANVAPCWLNNPVTKNQTGFIGTANAISIKKNGSLIASRKRSLLKLIEYYQYDFSIDEVKDFTKNVI